MFSQVQARILLNGRLIRAADARISPLGEGFMYGMGLFETVKVLRGRPVFFRAHAERLQRGAAVLGLAFKGTATGLARRCESVVSANRLSEGSLKMVLFQDTRGTGEVILTRKGRYAADLYERGFQLAIVPDNRPSGSVSAFKTLNYLANRVAKERAQAAGFDEAVFVGARSRVLEGTGTTVFAVEGQRVITPALGGGVLPGIARGNVLRLLGGKRATEGALSLSRLLGATEVFVTNALLGVMPVSRIDGRRYDLNRNPVTRAIQKAYLESEWESVSHDLTRPARKSIAAG